MSEAFRQTLYIIRVFCTNELNKSFKIYKVKSSSKLTWDYQIGAFLSRQYKSIK